MLCFKTLLLCGLMTQIAAFQFEKIPSDSIFKIMIPTLTSENLKCQNHTSFYVEELQKLRLWATEMFDASSKFPSGILFGSTYDFGNFDECIGVDVPLDGGNLKGRYCLAKFHVEPPELEKDDRRSYPFYEREGFVNVSAWEKLMAYSNERSRISRNDFHFSYCIPSSCQHGDLESSLQEVTRLFNASSVKVTATVNHRNCQLKSDWTFSVADISFMSVLAFFVVVGVLATAYDLQKCKFEGNKHKFLVSFSIWENLKKLCRENEHDEGLQCIHGLKVYSMFFIIMGHRIMFLAGSPLVNPNFIESLYGKIEATVLLNGPIIVDTFFNISGFLVCYLMLTQRKKINFIFLYVHRFIRLTPAYAVVLAFYCTLFVKMGSGPLWLERVQVEQERCVSSWWANLFYLNNYLGKDQICMFQSWYMTCDMHFFMVAPIIIWLLRKKPLYGLTTLFIIIALSISVVFTTVYLTEEDAILLLYMKFLKDPVINNTFKNIYIPTHMRASPYFIGMVAGYLKYVMRSRQYKMPKYMVYMGWIVSVFIIEVTVYSAFIFYIPGKPYDPLMSAIYASMHHITWSICISWMILAVSEGNGAWVHAILTWKPMVPLNRITYTAFLCHGAIQIYSAAILRYANYGGVFNLIFYTLGDISVSYFCGLCLSMFFEAPILGLERVLLRKDAQDNKATESKTSTEVTPKITAVNGF